MITVASMKFQSQNTLRQIPSIFHQSWRIVLSLNLETGDEVQLQSAFVTSWESTNEESLFMK